uniref:G_PROTEIN_RECEP_F1_2 domain-containing protein n=1 Tax=Parastrongyloides trichosuri TaxID=131310 RepID=A0A0N4ZM20_PARTI
MNNSEKIDKWYHPVSKNVFYHTIFGGYQIYILIINLIVLIKAIKCDGLKKMPLLRINIFILSVAFFIQSILQGAPSIMYIFAYQFHLSIQIDVCSAIRLFGGTVHGIVDFIPFSLSVIRYNLIFGERNKSMIWFWFSQVILVLIRLMTGIYPSVAKSSIYIPNSSCGFVKATTDTFMIALRIFSVASEIVFPIMAFIINVIIVDKVLFNLKNTDLEIERKEQKQLFWSLSVQILLPFFCHLPSIYLMILRMLDFEDTVWHVIAVDTLNTIAYSLTVFLSIIFIDKLRIMLFPTISKYFFHYR